MPELTESNTETSAESGIEIGIIPCPAIGCGVPFGTTLPAEGESKDETCPTCGKAFTVRVPTAAEVEAERGQSYWPLGE